MRGNLGLGLSCLMLLFVLVIIGRTNVASQGSLCYFTNTQVTPGQDATVPEGQPVQFEITLTGSCPTPGLYTFRADIVSAGTTQVLATDRVQLVANGQFTAMLSESAVAPAAVGTWSLQLNAYVLFNGAVVAPTSQQLFGLHIVPYTTPTTTQTTQSITQAISTTSYSIQSTSAPPTLTELQTLSSQNQAVTGVSGGLGNQIQLVGAALAILVVVIILLAVRRRRAKRERTRVY